MFEATVRTTSITQSRLAGDIYARRVQVDRDQPTSVLFPAWSGFCSGADRTKLEAFLRRCQRLGYCSDDTLTVTEMFEEADDKLFSRGLANDNHVLEQAGSTTQGQERTIKL